MSGFGPNQYVKFIRSNTALSGMEYGWVRRRSQQNEELCVVCTAHNTNAVLGLSVSNPIFKKVYQILITF